MKGKFNSLRDEIVYTASLMGFRESTGIEDGTHWSLVSPLYGRHYIVEETSDGFVTVHHYDTEKECKAAWTEVEREVARFDPPEPEGERY